MPTFFFYPRMRPTNSTTSKLIQIIETVCAGAGYELVDIALTQSRSGWVLQVFIDLAAPAVGSPEVAAGPDGGDGSGVGIGDCERVSRELSAVLDVEDPIKHAYQLEVSSPGLDRPLRTLEHFQRFIGQVAKLRLGQGLAGRRNFKGALVAVSAGGDERAAQGGDASAGGDGAVVVVEVDGQEFRLPFDDIESARVVPNWDELMKKPTPSEGPRNHPRGRA